MHEDMSKPDSINHLRDEILAGNTADVERMNQIPGTRGLDEYSGERDLENRIYLGDNLDVMKYLINEKDMSGKVDLVYIDPPYAADHQFEGKGGVGRHDPEYRDSFENSEYLNYLRERLTLIHELLSGRGSIYVHIGDEMMAYVKIMLDEIFGRDNYLNTISRRKCHSKNYTKNKYGNVQDFILFYAKDRQMKKWKRPTRPPNEEEKKRLKKEYSYEEEDTGRRYMKVPIHAPGERDGETGEPWRGMEPPQGKHWTHPPSKLEEMAENGLIEFSKNGNPRKKVYYDQRDGMLVTDMWLDTRDYYNQQQSITGYPTEKNINMLKRIVEASSEEGDLVLDAFMGSGTTLAAADQLNRNWIGIDNNQEAVDVAVDRLKDQHGHSPFSIYKVM